MNRIMGKFQIGSVAAIALAIAAPAYASGGSTYEVKGKPVGDDMCEIEMSVTLSPGEKAFQVDQVGFDPKTCTPTMKRVSPNFSQDTSVDLNTTLAPTGGSSSDSVSPKAIFRRRAFSRAIVFDVRNGRNQHQVTDYVNFLYDFRRVQGGCLRGTAVWNDFLWSRFGPFNYLCQYNFNRSTITAATRASFFSPAGFFCGAPTSVYYNRHQTVGYANGAVRNRYNITATRPCLSLLRIRTQIGNF